eukprot:EG_transcript_19018
MEAAGLAAGWGAALAGGSPLPDSGNGGNPGGGGGWGTAVLAPSTTVCVLGLPEGITEREFRLLFKFAPGADRCAVTCTAQGQRVGYARFTSLPLAQQAIAALHDQPLDEELAAPVKAFLSFLQLGDDVGSPLHGWAWGSPHTAERADWPDRGPGGWAGEGPAPKRGDWGRRAKEAGCSVYVGGIPHDWDDARVRRFFEPCGQVVRVNLTPGKNKLGNIAFIHFLTAAEAEVAIQTMNNHVLEDGRYLTVRCNTSPMAKS